MSKLNPLYNRGDIKYFRKEHIKRMELTSQSYVSYPQFYIRLKKGMSLREAIYTPSNTNMARNRINMKPKNRREELKTATYKMISFLSLVMRGKIKPKTE